MIAPSLIQRILPEPRSSRVVSLYFPSSWAAPRNPFAAQIESEAEDWFRKLGVIHDTRTAARFTGMAVGDYGGLPFPLANRAGLEAATRFLSLWLFHDDLLEGAGAQKDQILSAALRGDVETCPSGPPCLRGWWELGMSLRSRMDRRLLERLSSRFEDWLLTLDEEARLAKRCRQGRPPSVAEYLAVRLVNIGVFPTLLFIELTTGTAVPEAIAAHPAFQAIELLAAGLITIANDLFAFTKDHEQSWPNLVSSLAAEQQLSLHDAFAKTAALHRTWLAELVCAEEELLVAAPDMLCVKRWLRGVHHVAIQTQRFDESVRFYVDVLGCELLVRRPFKSREMAWISVGNVQIELFSARAGQQLQPWSDFTPGPTSIPPGFQRLVLTPMEHEPVEPW